MQNYNQSQDDIRKTLIDFLLTSFLIDFFIWESWAHFYFHIKIGESIILVINGNSAFIRPFFLMCFVSSIFISAFIFTFSAYNKLIKDNHHRGSYLLTKKGE